MDILVTDPYVIARQVLDLLRRVEALEKTIQAHAQNKRPVTPPIHTWTISSWDTVND